MRTKGSGPQNYPALRISASVLGQGLSMDCANHQVAVDLLSRESEMEVSRVHEVEYGRRESDPEIGTSRCIGCK